MRVRAIADKSLTYRLPPHDRGHLEAAVRRNEVELVPYADPHLIGRALANDEAFIVTNDRFRGLRAEFPGLDDFERIFAFRIDGGVVHLYRSPLERLGSATASHAAEKDQIEYRGFHTAADRELLRWDWRCESDGCPVAALPLLSELPVCRDAEAFCPECDEPLRRMGSAVGSIEVKLLVEDVVLERFAVAVGQSVVLGRSSEGGAVSVGHLLDSADAALVSRRHLRVTNHDGRLRVRDDGSRNGSGIRRANLDVDALRPGSTVVLGTADRACLAGVLEVQLSGRRWPRAAALRLEGEHPARETVVGATPWRG